jgi:hypothetical protein
MEVGVVGVGSVDFEWVGMRWRWRDLETKMEIE